MENDKLVWMSDVLRAIDEGIGRCPTSYYNGMRVARKVTAAIPAADAVEMSDTTKRAVELIVEERRRQMAEWGDQIGNHPFEWMSILGEEFGELCQAINESCFQNPKHKERGGSDAIIREAVQVAAVAVQIVEAYCGLRREEDDE